MIMRARQGDSPCKSGSRLRPPDALPAFRHPRLWRVAASMHSLGFAFHGQSLASVHPCTRSASPSMARAKTGTRTQDLRITNALLYQLSYLGMG